MTTVDITNLTPDDLVALDARIKELQAQKEAQAAAAVPAAEPPAPVEEPVPEPPSPTVAAPTGVDPGSLLDALGLSRTTSQLANAKAWLEDHLGIKLP